MEEAIENHSELFQEIHCYGRPYDHATPDRFVDNLVTHNLFQYNFSCFCNKRGHKSSSKCQKRLEILSAVLASFSYNLEKRSQTNLFSIDKVTRSMDLVEDCNQSLKQQLYEEPSGNGSVSLDSSTQLDIWYRQVCDKLAAGEFLLQLLRLQESSQCVFASLVIRKIICSAVVQDGKLATVLHYIRDKWNRTETICGFELDLLNALMSTKLNGDKKLLREQVYNWFIESEFLCLLSDFGHSMSWSDVDEFQDHMGWLSLHGKLLKHCVSSGRDIPVDLGNITLDILERHADIFFSFPKSNHVMGQFVLFKFIKIVTMFITVQICSGKVIPCEIIVKCCEKIMHILPPVLEMCALKGYMNTITFWGGKIETEATQLQSKMSQSQSSNSNVVMTREMFLLFVKATEVLLSKHQLFTLTDELAIVQKSWTRFQCGIGKLFGDGHRLLSNWTSSIPSLFGDQDDKWIEFLLSMLVIQKKCSRISVFKDHCATPNTSNASNERIFPTTIAPDTDSNSSEPSVFCDFLCPHKLFLQFMEFIYFDPIVVSDFLMSPETHFLEYFTKYLAYLETDWDAFVRVCSETDTRKTSTAITERPDSFPIMISGTQILNQKEYNHLDSSSSFSRSEKRKYSGGDLENVCSSSSKRPKTNNCVGPLVSYADTDSNNSDYSVEVSGKCSRTPSSSDNEYEHSYILQNERTSQSPEIGCNTNCKENDVESNSCEAGISGIGCVSSEDSIAMNVKGHGLNRKTALKTSTPASSLDPALNTSTSASSLDPALNTSTSASSLDPARNTSTSASSLDPALNTSTSASSLDPALNTSTSASSLDPALNTSTSASSLDPALNTSTSASSLDLALNTSTPASSLDPALNTSTSASSLDPALNTSTSASSLDPALNTSTSASSLDLALNTSTSASSSLDSSSDEQENVIFSGNESSPNSDGKTVQNGLHTETTLDSVLTMLIRLRFHIERLNSRQLFPYNTDFLLHLLSLCEEKYENV